MYHLSVFVCVCVCACECIWRGVQVLVCVHEYVHACGCDLCICMCVPFLLLSVFPEWCLLLRGMHTCLLSSAREPWILPTCGETLFWLFSQNPEGQLCPQNSAGGEAAASSQSVRWRRRCVQLCCQHCYTDLQHNFSWTRGDATVTGLHRARRWSS